MKPKLVIQRIGGIEQILGATLKPAGAVLSGW